MNLRLKEVKPLWMLTVITVNGGAVATVSVIKLSRDKGDFSCTAGLLQEV
jgi:hypothetical protein